MYTISYLRHRSIYIREIIVCVSTFSEDSTVLPPNWIIASYGRIPASSAGDPFFTWTM